MAYAADPFEFAITNGVIVGTALSGTAFGTVYGAISRIFTADQRAWALAMAGATLAIMGLLWLGTVPLTNGVLTRIFGLRYITTLFGLVFLGHQVGDFLGVWLGGIVYDHYRSYDLVWLVAIAIGVVAAPLHWPIDERALVRPSITGHLS